MNTAAKVITFLVALSASGLLAAPSAPRNLRVTDRPNDQGNGLNVQWTAPAPGFQGEYELFLLNFGEYAGFGKVIPSGEDFQSLIRLAGDTTTYQIEGLSPDHAYLVRLVAIGPEGDSSPPVTLASPIRPVANWFNTTRGWLAIMLIIVCAAVLAYIVAARRGMELWVRPIAGLEAVTDSVGRAVEMGKKILFIPGIQDINDIQTVAGVTVLSRVSRIAADYDAEMMVPTARSLVMVTCRETVAASYLQAGRPDSFNPDSIYYLTDQQFGYVAGAAGAMVREEPAACFYMGAFYAESLILAETGNSIGAIQVAGTAMPSQLPFFIAACDYTLIGEEFFAASAYLSGEPQQLGSLKGQDFGKLVCTLLIIIGCLIAPVGYLVGEQVVTRDPAVLEGAALAGEEPPLNVEIVRFLKENVLGGGNFLPEDWK